MYCNLLFSELCQYEMLIFINANNKSCIFIIFSSVYGVKCVVICSSQNSARISSMWQKCTLMCLCLLSFRDLSADTRQTHRQRPGRHILPSVLSVCGQLQRGPGGVSHDEESV